MYYNNYSFFEKYGLADLIFNYLNSTSTIISEETINAISEKDLIDYFNNSYFSKLESEVLTVLNGNVFIYSSIANIANPNPEKGEYISSHILVSSDENRRFLFNDIRLKFKSETFMSKGTVSPFSTKINSNFKREYGKFIDELNYISSIVGILTRNKLSFYDKGYYSHMPEFDCFIDYVYFIDYVDKLNRNIGTSDMQHDVTKNINRPNRQTNGNFLTEGSLLWSVDNNHYNDRVREYSMLFSFYNHVKKYKLSNISPKNWYLVQNGSIKKTNFSKDIIELFSSNDMIDIKSSINEFNVNNSNANSSDRIKLINFLERGNSFNLNQLLIKNLTFNKNNILINNYINKMNMDKKNKELVINFGKSISKNMYFKAKDYEAPNSNGKLNKLEERVINRKVKLIGQVKGLIKRSSSLTEFLCSLTDFYISHKIHRNIPNLEEMLNLEEDFSTIKNLLSLSLHFINEKVEVEIEEDFELPV